MFNITEGTEVLLKTGESVTVVSGFSSWKGQRWTGRGQLHGKDIQREFGDDDVRAVLGYGSNAPRTSAQVDTDSPSLF